MATRDDVFYGFCTFWTGDWEWLAERSGTRRASGAGVPAFDEALARDLGVRVVRPRVVEQPSIPHCPFCGSVGFEMPWERWLRSAQEWQDGTSPNAPGVVHPGYVAMLLWGEKKCFRDAVALEQAWAEAGRPGAEETEHGT